MSKDTTPLYMKRRNHFIVVTMDADAVNPFKLETTYHFSEKTNAMNMSGEFMRGNINESEPTTGF